MIHMLTRWTIPVLTLVMVFAISTVSLEADKAAGVRAGEQIKWQAISGGGAKGTSASYGLSGTVGQTAAGTGASASYTVFHGFWQDFVVTSCCDMAGDANNNGIVSVGDAVFIINFIFRDGPIPVCPAEANANGDLTPEGANKISVGDAVHIINFIFRDGPPPICL